MAFTLAIPKQIRQYRLVQCLTEGELFRQKEKNGKILLKFENYESIPGNLVFQARHIDLDIDIAVRLILALEEHAKQPAYNGQTLKKALRQMVLGMWRNVFLIVCPL